MSSSDVSTSEIIASAGSRSRDSLRMDDEFAMYGDAFPSEGEIFFEDVDEGGQSKAISFGGTVPAALEITRGNLSSLSVGNFDSAFAFIDTVKTKASDVGNSSLKHILSPKPLILLPNHFKVDKNPQVVLSAITKLFDDEYRNDICYALHPHECFLEGVYLRGSRYTDFNFRLYEDGTESLIIEGQRLDRESCGQTFRTVYDAVKRAVGMSVSPTSTIDLSDPVYYGIYDPSAIELTGATPPTDEEITETMRVMLSMLGDKSYNTQLEGAKMLCDLSEDETYRQRMAECGCVNALVTLLRAKDQHLQHHLRQQIVLTLAQLSCCNQCAQVMVETGLLLILMAPIYSNSNFKTAGYCREAARIIANVSSKLGTDAVKNIPREDLHGWIARIEDIEDKEIKATCERARHSIQPSKGGF